jgi:hypothetical protein
MASSDKITDEITQNWVLDVDNDDEITTKNEYILGLIKTTSLFIRQKEKVSSTFDLEGNVGLFRLLLTNQWFNSVRTWTNNRLVQKGLKPVNIDKFRAYLGLEIAMSIVQYNDMKYYWKTDMFTGHDSFKSCMSRDDFMSIRANLQLRPTYSHYEASSDPLWHCRSMLDHFQKNIAHLAVPLGTSALDEVSVRIKARTKASSFIANKPDKYAIKLYAVVGTKNTYLSSICDNRSGNTGEESGPEAFCKAHRGMRTPYNKILGQSDMVDKDSPSALWILQMAQQTKLHPDPSGKEFSLQIMFILDMF